MPRPHESTSHVDALIARYAQGRSIAELERTNDLPPGALSQSLRPSSRGRFPRFETQKRFADVLDAPLEEVSRAFAADADGSQLPLGASEWERELLAICRDLDDTMRAMVLDVARAARKHSGPDHYSGRDKDHES